MRLCDAGPLVAMIDRRDAHHARCMDAMHSMPDEDMVTTWPCFAEAMYLVGRSGGLRAQDILWGYVEDGLLGLHSPAPEEWTRMRALMRQYVDAPMDLGDASLVSAAERLGIRRIFTVDRHFQIYRIRGSRPFEVIPD